MKLPRSSSLVIGILAILVLVTPVVRQYSLNIIQVFLFGLAAAIVAAPHAIPVLREHSHSLLLLDDNLRKSTTLYGPLVNTGAGGGWPAMSVMTDDGVRWGPAMSASKSVCWVPTNSIDVWPKVKTTVIRTPTVVLKSSRLANGLLSGTVANIVDRHAATAFSSDKKKGKASEVRVSFLSSQDEDVNTLTFGRQKRILTKNPGRLADLVLAGEIGQESKSRALKRQLAVQREKTKTEKLKSFLNGKEQTLAENLHPSTQPGTEDD
jgi:hypothetical protein